MHCLKQGLWLQDHHLISLPTAAKLCSLNLSHCASLTANSLMFLKNMASLTFLDLSYSRYELPRTSNKSYLLFFIFFRHNMHSIRH